MATNKKLFNIIDDNDGVNVLGGSVPLESAYIAMYAAIQAGEKLPNDLEVGESTKAEYNLASSSIGARPKARANKAARRSRANIYRIMRVQ